MQPIRGQIDATTRIEVGGASSVSDATEGVKDDPTQEHRRAEGREWVDPIEIDHDVPDVLYS